MDYNINNNANSQPQGNMPNVSQPTPNYTPKKSYKKSLWKWILLYVLIGALAYGAIYYFFFYQKGDYTYTPQNTTDQYANWQTYTNSQYGFEFRYPDNFFDTGHEPKVLAKDCNYSNLPAICPNINIVAAGSITSNVENPQIRKIMINGNDYCVYQMSDGAAGHVYYYDYYATVKNQKCLVVELDTSAANCDNYLPIESGNTQQKQNYESCVTKNSERPNILSRIVSTFTFAQGK